MHEPIDIFFSCSTADEDSARALEKHLASLIDGGKISCFHAGHVEPGQDRSAVMWAKLDRARLVLLFLSADFLADLERTMELTRVKERRGPHARIIPILVRPCDWRGTDFGKFEPLPTNREPVTSWSNKDEAWLEVAAKLRTIIEAMGETKPEPSYVEPKFRALAEQLERARARRRALEEHGGDVTEVNDEILGLRRRLRDGGQLRPGDWLNDRYLLLRQVGHGGFATIWESYDRTHEGRVAVKVLHPNLAGDAVRLERFQRGARIMASLNQAKVVRVLEREGDDNGFHYFVLEFMPGGDLRQAVVQKRLTRNAALDVVLRAGDALAEAHARGMVHRDIKPSNILLDADGTPRLTDFDLVSACDTTGGTRTGALGTFIYAAPELMDRPQDTDARADVYGLGMTAVFAIYGSELPAAVVRHTERFVDDLPCLESIRAVLKRAIDLHPTARYRDAASFCEALRGAVGRPIVPTRHTSESMPSVDRDVLRRWSGSYRFTDSLFGGVWNYQVDIVGVDEQLWAEVTVDGIQTSVRLRCAAHLVEETRVSLVFEDYGQNHFPGEYEKGDVIAELERHDDGFVELLCAALRPSLPSLKSYVGKYPHELMSVREVGRRLRGLLKEDYDRFLDNMGVQGLITREGRYLFLEGFLPHSGGAQSSIAAINVRDGCMHVLVYDERLGRADMWSENWDAMPDSMVGRMAGLSQYLTVRFVGRDGSKHA